MKGCEKYRVVANNTSTTCRYPVHVQVQSMRFKAMSNESSKQGAPLEPKLLFIPFPSNSAKVIMSPKRLQL